MHIAEAGRGFQVVFLHGFPEPWYSWRHQLPALAAGFHAVAPDLRGYGDADAPADVSSYSMKELTADVVGLLDALGAERCVLVGHDWTEHEGLAPPLLSRAVGGSAAGSRAVSLPPETG